MTEHQDANPSISHPQIHLLHTDILLEVFGINAELYWSSRQTQKTKADTKALDVLRYTSQVCQKWRDLTLRSPSLWGKVIDSELIEQYDDRWRSEVLRRTGQSPLSIYGSFRLDSDALHPLFSEVLRMHWHRTYRLDICFSEDFRRPCEGWDIFLQPAPALEICLVRFDEHYNRSLFIETGRYIFANNAPLLREFSFPDNSTHHQYLEAQWVTQLHRFETTSKHSPSELFRVLPSMRALEHLELWDTGEIDTHDSSAPPSVTLPYLRVLKLSYEFKTSLHFLKGIIPSPSCSLELSAKVRSTLPDDLIDDMCQHISIYIANYFSSADSSIATVMTVAYSSTHFLFEACVVEANSTGDLSDASTFSFRVTDGGKYIVTADPAAKFLASITLQKFAHITKLEFIPEKIAELDQSQPDPTRLFLALPSLKVLMADAHGLELLTRAEKLASDLLPCLETYQFEVGFGFPTSESFPELLHLFLRDRVIAGHPMTTIDISSSTSSKKEKLDWGCLEDIGGLKVVMRRSSYIEYVCGTGKPEKLDTRQDLWCTIEYASKKELKKMKKQDGKERKV